MAEPLKYLSQAGLEKYSGLLKTYLSTTYRTVADSYTKKQVDDAIAAINLFDVVVADELPTASASTMRRIYLIPKGEGKTGYKEYITVRSGSEGSYTYSWEEIGDTDIDLSGYVKKLESGKFTEGDLAIVDASGAFEDSSISKAALQTVMNEAHEHANKELLDAYSHTDASIGDAITKAHTHANKATLDKISDASVAAWDDAKAKAHEHANKDLLDSYSHTDASIGDAISKAHTHANADVLDGITAALVANWNEAYSKEHDHTNKSTLDKISDASVAAWDAAAASAGVTSIGGQNGAITVKGDGTTNGSVNLTIGADKVLTATLIGVDDYNQAVTDDHTHDNKATLDKISDASVTAWDTAAANNHTHANKALLDTYTQTEASLADAVSKAHEHANKATLDKISDASVAAWDKISEKVDKTTTIAGVDLQDNITAAELTAALNEASTSAKGLMSSTDKSKLDGIEEGAEVNVIETVKVNGVALTVTDKAVDVTVPTQGTISYAGSATETAEGTWSGATGYVDASILAAELQKSETAGLTDDEITTAFNNVFNA